VIGAVHHVEAARGETADAGADHHGVALGVGGHRGR
jgi:hypothetical protein